MITFEKVFKRYPGIWKYLQNINLEISSGELVFVLVHQAQENRLFLNSYRLIEKPTSGSIIFENQNLLAIKR